VVLVAVAVASTGNSSNKVDVLAGYHAAYWTSAALVAAGVLIVTVLSVLPRREPVAADAQHREPRVHAG
jgi:hypothetical protein